MTQKNPIEMPSDPIDLSVPSPDVIPKTPDGSVDVPLAQARLREFQARADSLTTEELRDAIQLTRALRRTTSGPAKSKTKKSPASTAIADPDDLLNL